MKKTISHPSLKSILEKYFYGYPSEDTSELYNELSQREISEELVESSAVRVLRYAEVIQMVTNYTSSKVELLTYGMFIFYDIRTAKELNNAVIEILKQKESKSLGCISASKPTLVATSSHQSRNFLNKLNDFFITE
jgi:hypothetical protein